MTNSKKRILITGGTGYIGGHLVRYLHHKNHEIHVLSRAQSEKPKKALPFKACKSIRMHYFSNLDEIDSLFKQTHFDAVFHLAAPTPQDFSDPIQSTQLSKWHLDFGKRLIHAMTQNNCPVLINAGTYWQYGDIQNPGPNGDYAQLKEQFQTWLDETLPTTSIKAISLILFDIYGPNDHRPKLLPQLIKQGDTPLDLTDGYQQVSYVHVADVCRAFWQAFKLTDTQTQSGHHRYFVYNELITLRELVAQLESVLGRKLWVKWGAKPYPKNQIMNPILGPVLPGWTQIYRIKGFVSLVSAQRIQG